MIVWGTKNRGCTSEYEIHFNKLNERSNPYNLGWSMDKVKMFVRAHIYVVDNNMQDKPDEMHVIETEMRRIVKQGRAQLGQGILEMHQGHDFFDSNDEDQYPSAGSQMKNALVSYWHSVMQIDILLYTVDTT